MLDANADDYKQFAARLRDIDKKVANGIRRKLREVSTEVGRDVIVEGSQDMPGGLRGHLEGRTGSLRTSVTAKRLELVLGGKRPRTQFGTLDSGTVAHPVYGNRRSWVRQPVPAGTYTRSFTEGAGKEAAESVVNEVQEIITEAWTL